MLQKWSRWPGGSPSQKVEGTGCTGLWCELRGHCGCSSASWTCHGGLPRQDPHALASPPPSMLREGLFE